jgi:hypothetical protein
MKKCNKCKEIKPIIHFHKNKSNKDGYSYRCKPCCKESKELNKEKYSKTHKIWYNKTKKKRKEVYDKYRRENKELIKSRYDKYRSENKEYIKYRRNRKRENERHRERLVNDPVFRMKCRIKCLIYQSINRMGFSKKTKTFEILGCTFEEFKTHLESNFEDWMNWDNYGLYNGEFKTGWDIDHIIPISSAKTESTLLELNNFKNLQPLCSHINRNIKGDKLNFYDINI